MAEFQRHHASNDGFVPRATLTLYLLLLLPILSSATGEEEFSEELLLKPLPDRKVLAHFHFQSEAPIAEDSFACHHHLFPKSISQLVKKFHIKAMELSFTQGRWNYERWGGFDPISSQNAKPPGVELWAVFDVPPHQVDASWKNLTHSPARSAKEEQEVAPYANDAKAIACSSDDCATQQ